METPKRPTWDRAHHNRQEWARYDRAVEQLNMERLAASFEEANRKHNERITVTRPDDPEVPYCPECKRSIPVAPPEDAFLDLYVFPCPHCGDLLDSQTLPVQTFTLDPGLIEAAAAAGFYPEHFGGGIQHMEKILGDGSSILLVHPEDSAHNPETVDHPVQMTRYADGPIFDGTYPNLAAALEDLEACEDPTINPATSGEPTPAEEILREVDVFGELDGHEVAPFATRPIIHDPPSGTWTAPRGSCPAR